MQTKETPLHIPVPPEFTQRVLDYLANNTCGTDTDVEKLYAETYAKNPHDAGLRCFPPTIAQFDPCHKAMWSAAYDAAVNLKVDKEDTLGLQAHTHHMQSSLYGAYAVADIAQHHAKLINKQTIITTLPSSAWNLWDAILTGAGLRPLGYSLAHALTLMARSSHPSIVAKICCNAPWMDVTWRRLGGGHYIADDDFAPVMIHLAELLLQVKVHVHTPNEYGDWHVTHLTWASPTKLKKVVLLPTIDPRLAHKTGLVAALAQTLGYDSAAGWYETRVA
jgi:hypothetical protein